MEHVTVLRDTDGTDFWLFQTRTHGFEDRIRISVTFNGDVNGKLHEEPEFVIPDRGNITGDTTKAAKVDFYFWLESEGKDAHHCIYAQTEPTMVSGSRCPEASRAGAQATRHSRPTH